ncbi:MAG: hypothetical protein WC988_00805 [Patescibacteria group bacterium]
MNKKYLSIIPALSILVFISQTTYAVDRQGTAIGSAAVKKVTATIDRWAEQTHRLREKLKGGENLPIDLEERTNAIKERRDKICKNTQDRVNERWNKYYARRTDRVENMDKGLKVLEKRIEFYKGKGLDVSNLELDLVALTSLVSDYKTAYVEFLDLLEGAKIIPCANYEGQFLPKLKEAKDQWLAVKQKADTIRDYYRNTVKVHLEELRAQLLVEKKIDGTEEE